MAANNSSGIADDVTTTTAIPLVVVPKGSTIQVVPSTLSIKLNHQAAEEIIVGPDEYLLQQFHNKQQYQQQKRQKGLSKTKKTSTTNTTSTNAIADNNANTETTTIWSNTTVSCTIWY
jgi:phosphoenolpyruvate-protein kinase (PTS system EI component)